MEDFEPADLRFERGPQSLHPVYKMRFSARDLVRIGQLYLAHGAWGGRQIVSAAWLRDSVRPHVDLGGGRGYGYLWWSAEAHAPGDRLHADVPLYYASGFGGQYIVVLPGHDLVVVHRAARVDIGIDHSRMGDFLDVILQAMPRG
jgi:CubicO group peptidase (beta-lactamase class C family)